MYFTYIYLINMEDEGYQPASIQRRGAAYRCTHQVHVRSAVGPDTVAGPEKRVV
jgi:hypothetical protein